MFSKIALSFPLLLIVISGCSSGTIDSDKVDADEVYQKYSVIYDEESQTETAYANFKVAGMFGTNVRLVSPALITYQGNSMREVSLNLLGGVSTFYSATIHTQFGESEKRFEFRDNDERKYVNAIRLKRAALKSGGGRTVIDATRDVSLSWEGAPLIEQDVLYLSIETEIGDDNEGDELRDPTEGHRDPTVRSAHNFGCTVFNPAPETPSPCTFDPNDGKIIRIDRGALAELVAGKGRMRISRSPGFTRTKESGSRGGQIRFEYRSGWVPVEIKND